MRYRATSKRRPLRLILVLLTSLLAGLTSCAGRPLLVSPAPASLPATEVVLVHTAPEMQFIQPLELADGPITLRSVYDRSGGGQGLDACRLEATTLRCRYLPRQLAGATGPLLVEVTGQMQGGALNVAGWQPLDWDEAASRAAAEAALAGQAEQLGSLDWAQLARPDFAESSVRFRWDPSSGKATPVLLFSYDMAGDRIIWRAEGPAMAQQKPLVTRFPAIYLFTDLAGQPPVDLFVTIEGYVEE